MREQIEAITKQVDKIKEIAFTNREHLEYENKDLSEWEIEKIRESQKITEDITAYNIVNEYAKVKKATTLIRFWYTGIMILILVFLGVITSDYIKVKIKNEDVKNIEKQKIAFEKKANDLTQNLTLAMEKNNSLSTLVKQKDEQIELLKKSIAEASSTKPAPSIETETETENEEIQTPLTPTTQVVTTTGSWKTTIKTQSGTTTETPEIKRCLSTTTITINVRDSAGIDGKVLSFLNEGSEVEVMSKQTKNDRIWYEIKTNKITGWISSVWIEEFDSSCLK